MLNSSPSLLALNLDRITHDLGTDFNPLHRDFCLSYKVIESRDGYTLVSFALPDGMTRAFVQLLESMGGFLRSVDVKSRSSQAVAKLLDPSVIQEREKRQSDFSDKVCSLYDEFISQGMTSKDAITGANSALKAENHPWASYDIVLSVLRKQGKFRKSTKRNVSALRGCSVNS